MQLGSCPPKHPLTYHHANESPKQNPLLLLLLPLFEDRTGCKAPLNCLLSSSQHYFCKPLSTMTPEPSASETDRTMDAGQASERKRKLTVDDGEDDVKTQDYESPAEKRACHAIKVEPDDDD